MEESLQNKVKLYNERYQSLKPQYEEIMKRLGDQIGVIQDLETRLPDSLDSKDWTKYGLEFLDSKVKSFKNIDEVYCAQGMNKPDSFNYNLYQQNLEDLNNVTAEYNKRKAEVDSATDVYNSIIAERNAVQSQLDMDKWFTKDEWKTLDSYVVEETYSNDNYITTDNTTDTERFDIERQLYDAAWKDLSKKCRPQYQYSSTLSNVLTIPQFKGFLKYFQLGNFIRMATDYDTVIKLRLISFTVDYNDTSKIDVVFSDAIRVHDIYEDASSIQAQANSAAMSFQFNKDQYDKSVNQSNFVAEMRKYGLDVATTQIHNAKNQSQTWDKTGMTFRMWNEEKQDFDPEQIKIINNQIVFSDDGFKSAKMAIGKIPIDKNGNTVYAVNAEAILGKLFLGEYLTLQNQSGTYKFDDAGFIASSGKNSVRIQPNQSGELFSIYKGSNKQFYVDSDGNVHFSGDLTGSSGTFSGNISGGSINLGNGTFTVDSNGNMYASSGVFGGDCTFKGTLDGADGSFSGTLDGVDGNFIGELKGNTITGANISGGTINVGNGNLVVNDDGSAKLGTVDVAKDGLVSVDDLYISSTLKYIGEGAVEEAKDILSRDGRGEITLDIPFITNSNDYGNVHFDRTPFVDNPTNDDPSYLAREKWCNDKFALKTSLSSYLTKSDAKSEYLTKTDASKYTTKSEVESIVRKLVKSSALK